MATHDETAHDSTGREDRGTAAAAPPALSAGEAEQLTDRIALLAASGLPLVSGLRAAAAESGGTRVAAALEALAADLERGRTLAESLTASAGGLPRHIRGLLAAAARTGDLGTALAELVAHQRRVSGMRANVAIGLAYPALVVCLAVLVFLVLVVFTVGAFESLFTDFALQLPAVTQLLFWWHRHLPLVLAAGIGLVAAGCLAVRLGGGRAVWHRLRKTVPLFGALWHWSALAEWANLLSVLVRQRVPLPEALQLSAGGIADDDVRQFGLRLAEGVAQGQPLTHVLARHRRGPVSLVPLVRWGEETGALAEALATARDVLEARVRTRALLLQSVLPPVLFPLLGCVFLFVIVALFMPMGMLINALSS